MPSMRRTVYVKACDVVGKKEYRNPAVLEASVNGSSSHTVCDTRVYKEHHR